MKMGEIWGASDKPEPTPPVDWRTRRFNDTKEAMLMIHHKIVALHDEFDTAETMVDNEGLRMTTGLYPNAWQAVIDLNISFFDERPMSVKRICEVADALLDTTHDEWLKISAAGGKLILNDRTDEPE